VIVGDTHCFFKSSHVPTSRVVEYFYWSGDMPEIVREQAHLLYQHVLANPKLRHLFENQNKYATYLNHLIKRIIYPDWDNSIFQADKADSSVWSSQHAWLMREQTPALDAWQSTLNSHVNMIDSKYFTFYPNSNRVHGIKKFYSRNFPIGVMPRVM
jgi:hypothetical protein